MNQVSEVDAVASDSVVECFFYHCAFLLARFIHFSSFSTTKTTQLFRAVELYWIIVMTSLLF